LAVGLAMVPVVGWLAQSGWGWNRIHPALNALLNAASAVFIIAGGLAIRRRALDLHRQCMIAAVSTSTVFLVSYLIRFAISGAHRYPGDGVDKTIYLSILLSHMVLAVAGVPLVLRAVWFAVSGQLPRHKRVVRFAYPIWLYVSVTGVVVYLMLYHLAPRLH
jgi:putative membrane protein